MQFTAYYLEYCIPQCDVLRPSIYVTNKSEVIFLTFYSAVIVRSMQVCYYEFFVSTLLFYLIFLHKYMPQIISEINTIYTKLFFTKC